jgi:hypothetical protein
MPRLDPQNIELIPLTAGFDIKGIDEETLLMLKEPRIVRIFLLEKLAQDTKDPMECCLF